MSDQKGDQKKEEGVDELTTLKAELKKITLEKQRLEEENTSLRTLVNQGVSLANRTHVKTILGAEDGGVSFIGKTVGIAGWVKTMRIQGSGSFAFVELNDGSQHKGIQAIVDSTVTGFAILTGQGETPKADVGSSLFIKGAIVNSPGKGQKVELRATEVQVLGLSDPTTYPLSKKGHTLEHLRKFGHLRSRTNTIGAMSRVRNALAFSVHKYFQEQGFLYVHTPILTSSDCEGAGEMFQVTNMFFNQKKDNLMDKIKQGEMKQGIDWSQDFFGKPTFLTVSGQLSVECYACSLSSVYTFGPTFRAEYSHTRRHLAEFWMIEPELAFADLKQTMKCAEDFLKYVIKYAMTVCAQDLEFLERLEKDLEKQKKKEEQLPWKKTPLRKRLTSVVDTDFKRITYTQAIEILTNDIEKKGIKFKVLPKWGEDLASEHEQYLCERVYKKPLIVIDYPKCFKAFYMRANDDGKTVAAMDILVPGMGEIIGGSQREERYDVLKAGIEGRGLEPESYEWYLDLRKYGSVPHSGFGLGFERLVNFVTGLENIRDAIPFPRYPGHCEF